MVEDGKFEILGFDLPAIAIGLSGVAIVVAGFGLINQWRTDQQKAAEDAARRQQAYYRKYYSDYYKGQEQPTQAPKQQGPTYNDFDRIWVPEGTPSSSTNTIKPEYMYGTPSNSEPLPDELDPDMQRANEAMGNGGGEYYTPPDYGGGDYDPSAPENLDYDEQTGELRARQHGNESSFGANVAAPQG